MFLIDKVLNSKVWVLMGLAVNSFQRNVNKWNAAYSFRALVFPSFPFSLHFHFHLIFPDVFFFIPYAFSYLGFVILKTHHLDRLMYKWFDGNNFHSTKQKENTREMNYLCFQSFFLEPSPTLRNFLILFVSIGHVFILIECPPTPTGCFKFSKNP